MERSATILWLLPILTVTLFVTSSAFSHSPPTRSRSFGVVPTSLPLISPKRREHIVLLAQLPDEGSDSFELSSPLNKPALATLDVAAILGFAAVGKASHATDGSIDPSAVVLTGLPFITTWIATSPLTGIYEDLKETGSKASVAKDAAFQTVKGWVLAVPLGCAFRGVIKGHVPPLPLSLSP